MAESEKTGTSPSLLIRIRDPGDRDAWEQFLTLYSSIVRDYCLQRRLQPTDIEDLTQEVMTTVSNSIRKFEYDPEKGRFRAWLGTVAANKIKTFLAKQMRQQGEQTANTSETAPLTVSYSDPDSDWVAIFSEKIFKTACAHVRHQVSDLAWECFECSWMRRIPSADVAAKLSIPVHQVYVNKSRVMKCLESEVCRLAEDTPIAGN